MMSRMDRVGGHDGGFESNWLWVVLLLGDGRVDEVG